MRCVTPRAGLDVAPLATLLPPRASTRRDLGNPLERTVGPKLGDGADVGRHRDSNSYTARRDGLSGGDEQGTTQDPTRASQRQYERGVAEGPLPVLFAPGPPSDTPPAERRQGSALTHC
jgi:hypothetical protein